MRPSRRRSRGAVRRHVSSISEHVPVAADSLSPSTLFRRRHTCPTLTHRGSAPPSCVTSRPPLVDSRRPARIRTALSPVNRSTIETCRGSPISGRQFLWTRWSLARSERHSIQLRRPSWPLQFFVVRSGASPPSPRHHMTRVTHSLVHPGPLSILTRCHLEPPHRARPHCPRGCGRVGHSPDHPR